MDSNRIAKLAQGVRDDLRRDISDSLERILKPASAERLARPADVERVERLAKADRDALVERVAYTWFNRLCALRFMDARGYTPVGCVTARPGESLPAILADARQGVLHPELPMRDDEKTQVLGLLDGSRPAADPLGEAYALLLLSACAAYQDSMGYLFGGGLEERSAMRLLHPTNLTADDGILSRIVSGMDDEACSSVEVLGWLYQYYIAERRKQWNDSKDKANPKDIAPATQLFTPNYIVRFLTENSLGRLWMLNNPGSDLTEGMDYYLAPKRGEEGPFIEVDGPEDITVCDPACGSGHILVYAFDLLFRMYQEEGYMDAEIPALILENNLFGMEIDPRAAEIASFALEMKAREKDPGFLQKDVDPHITVLEPISFTLQELAGTALPENHGLLDAFAHLMECGSLYVPKSEDLRDVEDAIEAVDGKEDLFTTDTPEKLKRMKVLLEALGRRYSCVIANPPYMGSSKFDAWTSAWIKANYPNEKADLCTCFIRRGIEMVKSAGYAAEVTMQSWMFLSSFEKMRKRIIERYGIVTMAHLGAHGFDAINGEVVQTTMTVFANAQAETRGSYLRLVDGKDEGEKSSGIIRAIKNPDCGWFYRADQQDFKSIPGWPIAYWVSDVARQAYSNRLIRDSFVAKEGVGTRNDKQFLRFWWEIESSTVGRGKKWLLTDKAGGYRKWYLGFTFVMDWEDDGYRIRNYRYPDGRLRSRPQNLNYLYLPGVSWGKVGSGDPSFRLRDSGFGFNDAAPTLFGDHLLWVCGMLNSSVLAELLHIQGDTLNLTTGVIGGLPLPDYIDELQVDTIVSNSKSICQTDWDSFETSWGFTTHPLAQAGEPSIERQFARWQAECRERFDTLKSNEEELNRIFARIYHMEGEVPIEVPDDKVSVRLADEQRDVKSLISYGIGCIFGRYSTDKPGLILADAGQTAGDYRAKVSESGFSVDEDAVLPVIALEDVSLGDDIVRRFRGWLSYVYGDEALDDNVSYIEGVLGKDLLAYFAKDFYKDHCDTYSVQGSGKRPIYWMFSSPKGSFQALVYMHRMNRDTVSTVLTEYVRPFRQRLLAQIGVLRATGAARDVAKADKYQAMVDELEGWERDVLYPLSQKHVTIDLDDGVRHNYKLFRTNAGDALAKVQGLS